MKGLIAYSLSKKYTADTADAMGAVKGAPCEVYSTEYDPESGITTVTFQWEGDSGAIQLGEIYVHDGEQGEPGVQGDPGENGRGIKRSYVDPTTHHVIVVYDDNTTDDWGEITVVGGGGELEDDLTTSLTVGGISSGTTYETGTKLEQLFRDMLNPVAYPTLTNPSASLSATGAKLLKKGATLNVTFTLTLNRGSINPAYGTSGYRSGIATSYTFDGETQSTNTFARTVSESKTSYNGTIAYEAGEQPKDSTGRNYNNPLPAGSVTSGNVTYEFVMPLWANTSNIGTIAELALVSKNTKQKDFAFPAQTVANPEVFDVPADWVVTAVQVKNDLSGAYEDALAQFTVTDTTHNDASGASVNYKRYTFNLGYGTGARSVRLKWS